ncbi:MAG: hypothetical protein ABSG82_08565 [Sedimentisphaerales bacterium]|jgi:hypothetical protein
MTNIFEQPWLLLIVAGVVLLAVLIFRSGWPERHRWWFWLLPVVIAVLAFAIDFFVQTDKEKVEEALAQLVRAVEKEDVGAIEALISDDYSDSFHTSKKVFLTHCRARLSEPVIEKNVHRIVSIDVKPPNATVVFTVRVVFDPRGPIYEYRKMMFFKLQAELRKEGEGWLFTRIDVLEIDMQPADWQHIQGIGGEMAG